MNNSTYTPEHNGRAIPCLVCGEALTIRLARGKKSGKLSVMLVCGRDGRHFRGFICDERYLSEVLELLETRKGALTGERP